MQLVKGWVLQTANNIYRLKGCQDYYTGGKYTFQGEYYAIVDKDITKAKIYSSAKIAENAMLKLNKKVVNYRFEVEQLKE